MRTLIRCIVLGYVYINIAIVFSEERKPRAFYISYLAGNDQDSGFMHSPFKHCPGDKNATDIPSNTNLIGGDTLVFKGGVSYFGRIDAEMNGRQESPILYTSGHLLKEPWGEGKAIIRGDSNTYNFDSSYIGTISIKSSNIKIQSIAFRFVRVTGQDSYYSHISWKGNSGGNITILDCEIDSGGGNGIYLHGGDTDSSICPSKFNIIDCKIGHCGAHGIFIRNSINDVLVENCTIHDCSELEWGDGIFSGSNTGFEPTKIRIRKNRIYNHPLKGAMNISGRDVVIEENYIYNTAEEAIGLTIGAEYYRDGMKTDSIVIRNNIINVETKYEGAIRVNMPLFANQLKIRRVHVYNNTIIQRGLYYGMFISKGNQIDPFAIDSIYVFNNIVVSLYGSKTAIFIKGDTKLQVFECDHNHYYTSSTDNAFVLGKSILSFNDWQALGYDNFKSTTSTVPYVQNLDPAFSDNITFRLERKSPCVNKGKKISSIIMHDIYGTKRDDLWDIGAVEYRSPAHYDKDLPRIPFKMK